MMPLRLMRPSDRVYRCYIRRSFHRETSLVSTSFERHRYRTLECGSTCGCRTSHKQYDYNSKRQFSDKPFQSFGDNTDHLWSKKAPKTKYDPTAKRPNRICDPYGQGGQPLSYEDATKLRTTLHTDWIFHMPPSKEATVERNSTSKGSNHVNHHHGTDTQKTSSTSTSASMQDDTQKVSANHTMNQPISTDSSDNGNNSKYALPVPMYTATEEVQRAFATLSPTTTTSPESQPQQKVVVPTITSPNNNNNNNDSNTKLQQLLQPPLALIRTFQHPDFMSGSRFVQSMAAVAQLTNHYPTLSLERKIINRHWYIISTIQCQTVVLGGLSSFDFHLATMIDIEVERAEVRQNILQEVHDSLSKVWDQI